MFFKTKQFQLGLAFALGIIVILLPRPEGTRFKLTGDANRLLLQNISQHFTLYFIQSQKSGIYSPVFTG